MDFINPSDIVAPASRYSQGIVVPAHARRLIVSGQIGMTKDGKIVEGLEAQLRLSWQNLFGVLRAAGMEITDLVKTTGFVTDPNCIGVFRKVREEVLQGHPAGSTFLVVAGLAVPALLCEIEAEAART
ncbi:MAG TPA: RidA family protein [Candidatus Cybelea sp.]|nr:RidA family protein [Candidatus Cybelea sp.]